MTITLTEAQKDRASGVLLGQAVGDALGVPYEFEPRIVVGTAEMIGGGLGPYEPGEWSDDTQMASCIALVTADGGNLNGYCAQVGPVFRCVVSQCSGGL